MTKSINEKLGTASVIWQLADLYEGYDDPAIEEDIVTCEKEAATIRNQYENQVKQLDAQEIVELVKRLEEMHSLFGRIATFAYLQFSTQSNNQQVSAFLQRIREVGSRISKDTVFFELEWNQLSDKKALEIFESDTASNYHHYLDAMRRYLPHQLSKVEESLLLEVAPVGRGSWTTLFEKLLGHLKFGENKRMEEEVLADLYNVDRTIRYEAAKDLTEGLKDNLHILTHIFNTLLGDKMISDRLRSYDSWVSSMNLGNELNGSTVDILVETVVQHYSIVQRYYTLKKDLLELDKLYDYDRYAPLPNLPVQEVGWKKAKKMVIDAFAEFSQEMAEIAQKFFDKNWIHAPIVEGKRGGAFAHPCIPEIHPYVLVNYTGNLRDVSTLAHELGHGVHQFLAADLGYFNSDTPLVLAETASVFAELLVFTHQLEMIHDAREKRAFICQKLESIFATVFRQISMNRFEDLVHNARREKGELTSENISKFWMTTQKDMFGSSVVMSENYAIWWSYIPHFLSTPGYVYSYAFGELLVLALYNFYKKEGDSFVPKYLNLLKAGGSLSPYELLRTFGVDPNDEAFWAGGLQIIDEMLMQVESLS